MIPPEILPSVTGDIAMIERVLTNILENALAHTQTDGSVLLSLNCDSESVHISISDTGVGISPEDIPHIFERFYRADKSRDRRTPGTGLGLAIAKEIVLLHKGQIEVFSTEGSGTLFRITLPF